MVNLQYFLSGFDLGQSLIEDEIKPVKDKTERYRFLYSAPVVLPSEEFL